MSKQIMSMRRDHDLIEKILKSMCTAVSFSKTEKTIPKTILMPVIDFTKNLSGVIVIYWTILLIV